MVGTALLLAGGCATTAPAQGHGGAATGTVVVHGTEVPPLDASVDGYPQGTAELVAADGTVHRLPVRVAATDARRAHGLMEVRDLPPGTGMAFTYASDRTGAYTMRGTLVPLQIAWADADGRIVAMADMVPCDAAPCPTYAPDATYRTALEVPAGWFDEVGVGVGDRLAVVQ